MSDDFVVKGPEVVPFVSAQNYECAACGSKRFAWWLRFVTFFRGKVPIHVTVRTCMGGKPPSEEVGVLQAAMTGQSSRTFGCAGVDRPHLHIHCDACCYSVLMDTATHVKNGWVS